MNAKQWIKPLTTSLAAIAFLAGGALADENMARDLTVEQNAVYNVQATTVNDPTALDVKAWVDHQDNTYAIGEKVRIFVQTNKDAYVTVLNVGASGQTIQLLPNQFQASNFVKANTPTEVPAPNANASITVTGPVGSELIKVIARTADKPVFTQTGTTAVGAFRSIDGGAEAAARDLQVTLNTPVTPQPGSESEEWDTYNKIIRTVTSRPVANTVVAPVAQQVTTPVVQQVTTPVAVAGNYFVTTFPAYINSNVVPVASLKLATDKNSYRAGEPINVAVTTDRACYLTLLNYQQNGQSVILFPNNVQTQNQIQPGQTLLYPGQNTGLNLIAQGPVGISNLIAVCDTQNTQLGPDYSQPGAAIRDLAVIADQPASQSAQAIVSFFITQ
jgi:hypothetical protein